MLYKIKDDYYILVENRYVKVDFDIKGDNVEVRADNSKSIEKTSSVVATSVSFNDTFKKDIIKNNKKPTYFNDSKGEDKSSKNSMFGSKSKKN